MVGSMKAAQEEAEGVQRDLHARISAEAAEVCLGKWGMGTGGVDAQFGFYVTRPLESS